MNVFKVFDDVQLHSYSCFHCSEACWKQKKMSHLIFCMKQKLAAILRSAKREEELNSAFKGKEQWFPNCGVGPICEAQNDSVDAREKEEKCESFATALTFT